jgi:putative lipase involved disintegration of autophagic bodies
VNGIDGRIQNSLDFFDNIQIKYPDAKKRVCGHSLG